MSYKKGISPNQHRTNNNKNNLKHCFNQKVLKKPAKLAISPKSLYSSRSLE